MDHQGAVLGVVEAEKVIFILPTDASVWEGWRSARRMLESGKRTVILPRSRNVCCRPTDDKQPTSKYTLNVPWPISNTRGGHTTVCDTTSMIDDTTVRGRNQCWTCRGMLYWGNFLHSMVLWESAKNPPWTVYKRRAQRNEQQSTGGH